MMMFILCLSPCRRKGGLGKVNRGVVLESKFGGNIRVNILYLTHGWEPWAALGLESKFGGNIRVNILYL